MCNDLIEQIEQKHDLSMDQWIDLLSNWRDYDFRRVQNKARAVCNRIYGNLVFLRGLIEITSVCRQDCFYCGLRCSNSKAERYRLNEQEIYACCEIGYAVGLRSFVLQGGEDPFFTDEAVCALIKGIKARWPDVAVTLSLGEKPMESYRLFREAGADRYLLRHETADARHYALLHPMGMQAGARQRSISQLKQLGFQVGAGFMVGSPGQSPLTLAHDFYYLQRLKPHMVGIGPFIPHADTPFADYPPGDVEQTLFLLSIARLLLPNVLLPATTALSTLADDGWAKGVLAGANVLMPNLTPPSQKRKYRLYDGKRDAAEAPGANAIERDREDSPQEMVARITKCLSVVGCAPGFTRGDALPLTDSPDRGEIPIVQVSEGDCI